MNDERGPIPGNLCIECFHCPNVHGVKDPTLEPCSCCESPAAIAAARGLRMSAPIPPDARQRIHAALNRSNT